MAHPIRVLHLEDSPLDAELLRETLARGGVSAEIVLVSSREQFEAALAGEAFDLILSDYNVPGYDGMSAVEAAHRLRPETPLIVVSGTVGEGQAVRCLHIGAADYLLKHHLERLVPAVQRAIREAEDRRSRLETEARLRESEARFRLLAEHSNQGFWFVAMNPFRVLYVSPAIEHIWGRPAASFYQDAASWLEAIHPDDAARVGQEWDAVLQNAPPSFEMEYRVVRPDGSVRWVIDRGTLIQEEPGAPAMMSGVVTDVTDRKQLEAQYLQAQRMESVGQLAGGIAHDFNNLLTVINGMAELAQAQVPDGGPLQEDLREIRQAGERAAALTRQLLAFSRKQILQPQVLDLTTVAAGMESLLQRLIGEDIDLVLAPSQGLGNVKADPGQIEQVIANLAVNARDAMPHGGQLTIETRNVEIDAEYGRQHGLKVPPGPYVQLTVSDTGVGMDAPTRRRIFEPFFTTKGPGHGTGLGLSTVYGIVKQSDGFIFVYSEVSRGTTFKIYLPRVAERAGGTRPGPTLVSASGTETILLVEDMGGLRTLTTRLLKEAGYTVLTAADGEEALRVLERDQPVHLLLTDVVMPGMSAQTLVERIHATRPSMKVLYMSGYTDDVIVRHGELREGTFFLGKPFTRVELTRKVREVLDAEG